MPAKIDYSGYKFGKLTVVNKLQQKSYEKAKYYCVCDCGTEVIVSGSNLVTGHTKSCGCLTVKHGLARKERLYNIWVGMRQRCRDKKSKDYPRYGGRGISVCKEWNDYDTFRNWALNSGYNDTFSIDRINVNGNYEPSNCRWESTEAQNNNKTNNTSCEFNGETHTLAEWARIFKIPYRIVVQRHSRNWDIKRILTTPVRRHVS